MRAAVRACLIHSRVFVMAWVVVVYFSAAISGAAVVALPPPARASVTAEVLKWKFNVGEVIEVKQHIVNTITSVDGQQRRNDHDYHCLWTVTEVEPDGLATIVVKPTLIRILSGKPPFEFDSRHDDPTVETAWDLPSRPYLYEARSMANAEFTIKAHPTGGVRTAWGALPDLTTIPAETFTTGDLPGLPAKRVSLGESWTTDIRFESGDSVMTGLATYRFTAQDQVDGRWVHRIEGDNDWNATGPMASSDLGPQTTVSHFDAKAGRFLDERNSSGAKFVSNSGEHLELETVIVRHLQLRTQPADEFRYSGENAFAFLRGEAIHLMIAGEKHEPKEARTADQFMLVTFYHEWDDADGNGIPETAEMSGLNTQFTEREGIKFMVSVLGMQDADIRAELIGSHGEMVGTIPIPAAPGPAAYAIRHLQEIEAGVYFLEWYVNDAFLIRMPVQVHSLIPSHIAKIVAEHQVEQETDDATEQSDLVVVTAAQIELRLGKQVLGTCQMGDVFRVVAERDSWVFLRSPAQKGWARSVDVTPLADAFAELSSYIERNPRDARALCARGRFLIWISQNSGEALSRRSGGETALRELAATDFEQALRLDPNEPMAYAGKGMTLGLKGETERALAEFDVALRLDSGNLDALYHRAVLRMQLNDIDGAIADSSRAIALHPQNATLHDFRGLLHGIQGQWDEGIADCDRAIKLNPKLATAYQHRGDLWHGKGDDERALADYDEAVRLGYDAARAGRARILYERGQIEDTINEFTELIKIDPDDAVNYFRRGTAHLLQERPDEAIADLNRAIELAPNESSTFVNRAMAWSEKTEFAKAVEDLTAAIRLEPDTLSHYRARADLLGQLGEFEKQIEDLTKLITAGIDDASGYAQRAFAWYSLQHYDNAIADLNAAILRAGNIPELYQLRGSAYNHKHEFDLAIADFSMAIELAPEAAETYAYRGVSWFKTNEDAKALLDFDKALELDPTCVAALMNRGSYWESKEAYADAISDFRQAAHLSPNRAAIHDRLAWLWATCQKAEFRDGAQAIESATRACELTDWKEPEHLGTLAAAYAETGDFEKAIEWQAKVLDGVPDTEREEAEARLDQFRQGRPYRSPKPVTGQIQ